MRSPVAAAVTALTALALTVAVAGCASSGGTTSASTTTSTAPAVPAGKVAARIELSATTAAAGSPIKGTVIVTNRTGHALSGIGCGSMYVVALKSDRVTPTVAWPMCAGKLTIPTGTSTYPVEVTGRYLSCSGSTHLGGLPTCLKGGVSPPLPAGTYEATLYQNPELVPSPPTVTVHLT